MDNFNYDKLIVQNMDAKIKKTRRLRNFCIVGVPLGFAMFGGGGALSVEVGIYFIPMSIVGFFLMPVSFFCSALLSTRLAGMRKIIAIRDMILSQDKVLIYQLCGDLNDMQTIMIINKLIATGNLEGYVIIGNVMVAKASLYISEEDAREEYSHMRFGVKDDDNDKPSDRFVQSGSLSEYAQKHYDNVSAATGEKEECPYCHAAVNSGDMFCKQCGSRLKY